VTLDLPAWPPQRSDLLLPHSPHRPISQGDIFLYLPFVKASPPREDGPQGRPTIEARAALVLGYPCEMYRKATLLPVQTIAVLRRANDVDVPADWFSRREPPQGAFKACPLPDPLGDGELMAVDFRALSNIDAQHLQRATRVASLTEYGTAYLRQRITLCFSRVTVRLSTIIRAGRATFDEMELWELWNERGHPSDEYQRWLDAVDPDLGAVRRDALERGLRDEIRSAVLRHG